VITVMFMACTARLCEPVEIRAEATRMQCELRIGQLVAAQWIAAHPEYERRGRIVCFEGEHA
jgi:hypothetical protein